MPTNTILATGITALTSADITIAVGSTLSVFLRPATGQVRVPNGASINIMKKSGSDYYLVANLNIGLPAAVITAAGVYRFDRGAQDVAIGVDSET